MFPHRGSSQYLRAPIRVFKHHWEDARSIHGGTPRKLRIAYVRAVLIEASFLNSASEASVICRNTVECSTDYLMRVRTIHLYQSVRVIS
ncbi:hypothetical protein BD311DRAFT_45552 [Dichomitus squalens]|uniref:Uncharacterized protein n=1 Tax=Dichomitus squalens TaxID=114155 RepID=A0A4Q9MDX8_9APHY|nr:hypothetical protein BD311DRAFT_45552 [Dichomitus squalens]